MTAPGPTTLQCPKCYEQHVMIGASGAAICPDCAHTWNPDNPLEAATPRPAPFGLPTTDEVFGTLENGTTPSLEQHLTVDDGLAYIEATTDPETFADRQSEFVGGAVVLEGGQVATLVAWTYDDGVVVRLATNDLEKVHLNDVQRIMPPIPDVEPVQLPETEDELTPDLALALRLARVIVGAGCESLYRRDRLGVAELPPTGFLPTEPELLPVIEQACGLAVAMLVEAFELNPDDVIAWADIEAPEVQEATETTEVSE